MILSQTSLSGAFPVTGAHAPAGAPDGGKPAGGFLDGLLACLCEEGPVPGSTPGPVHPPRSAAQVALTLPEPVTGAAPDALAMPALPTVPSDSVAAPTLLPMEPTTKGEAAPAISADGVVEAELVEPQSGDAVKLPETVDDDFPDIEPSDDTQATSEPDVLAPPPHILQDAPRQADSSEPAPAATLANGSEQLSDGKATRPTAEGRPVGNENPTAAVIPLFGMPSAPASGDRPTQTRPEGQRATDKSVSLPRADATPAAAPPAAAGPTSAATSRSADKAGTGAPQTGAAPLPDSPVPTAPDPTANPDGVLRSGGGAASAVAAPPLSATPLPPPVVMTQNADWPQTVVSATLATLTPEGGTMVLELAPDELGALQITLTLEGDAASVSIQTETAEAARALNEAERQLAQEFARHGVTLSAHDAQTGRRGDGRPQGAAQTAAPPDDPSPSDSAAPLMARGILNLIA